MARKSFCGRCGLPVTVNHGHASADDCVETLRDALEATKKCACGGPLVCPACGARSAVESALRERVDRGLGTVLDAIFPRPKDEPR